MKKIAIIGAGIAGSELAKLIQDSNTYEVSVFEKARGAGGRCSSRRFEQGKFDHGAQTIEVRSDKFKDFIDSHLKLGNVSQWQDLKIFDLDANSQKKIPLKKKLYLAKPAMNQICKYNLGNPKIKSYFAKRVQEVKKKNDKLTIVFDDAQSLEDFDIVVSTAPPAQSTELLKNFSDISKKISKLEMHSQFALMIASKKDLNFDFDILEVKNSIIKQITVNSNKPERSSTVSSIVVHSSYDWSNKNAELDPELVKKQLIAELKTLTGFEDTKAVYQSLHRWLYSRTKDSLKENYIWNQENSIGICADWCLGDDIESAFLSANKLATEIIKL